MDKKKVKVRDKLKSKVIDLELYRKNKSEARRREYERILFNRVLGVYVFLELEKLFHIEVIDISTSGLRFCDSISQVRLKEGDKVALRFYLTPNSFLRVVVQIKRVQSIKDPSRQGIEYGCEFDRNTKSYDIICSLVNFLQKYADVACQDEHPPLLWY